LILAVGAIETSSDWDVAHIDMPRRWDIANKKSRKWCEPVMIIGANWYWRVRPWRFWNLAFVGAAQIIYKGPHKHRFSFADHASPITRCNLLHYFSFHIKQKNVLLLCIFFLRLFGTVDDVCLNMIDPTTKGLRDELQLWRRSSQDKAPIVRGIDAVQFCGIQAKARQPTLHSCVRLPIKIANECEFISKQSYLTHTLNLSKYCTTAKVQ